MDRRWWLVFATALLSVWNAGIVWFTQVAVYPLWPLVDSQHFHDFHLTWWQAMQPAFAPVVLMFAGSIALLWLRPAGVPKWLVWAGVLLQVTVHAFTAFFWAPIQAAMATPQGMSVSGYRELMDTHWWRVAFFAGYAALMIWMVGRASSTHERPPEA